MFNPIQHLRDTIHSLNELKSINIVVIGLVGLIGSPLAYFFWSYIQPQPYESFLLRVIATIISIPVVFYSYLPKWFIKYRTYYFLIALTFHLPFLFGFMLFMNEYSLMWQMSFLMGLLLMMIIIDSWLLILVLYIIGTTLSLICYMITVDTIIWPDNPLGIAFIYGFAFIVGHVVRSNAKALKKMKAS